MKKTEDRVEAEKGDRSKPMLVTIKWVMAQTSLSVSAIHERSAEGCFPKPLKLPGSRSVRWVAQEVHDYIAAAMASRNAPQTEAVAGE